MDYYALISERLHGIQIEANFSFARHTTIGCGGAAAVCASPADEGELLALLSFLKVREIPICMLGAGANVLPADGFFEGVVIRFTRFNTLDVQGTDVFCGAGVTAGALLRSTEERNIGGFEFLTGIPASIGGAVVMNAGVGEGHLSDVVQTVTAIENGKLRTFSWKECEFSVKHSLFQSGIAVTGVHLKGISSSRKEIKDKKAYFRAKRAHLPKGRSMGCVFVNPPHISAGALIEQCGCKGLSVGRAFVSKQHGNFIINEGATAGEIASLIDLVKQTVFEKTGIRLREEIRRIP